MGTHHDAPTPSDEAVKPRPSAAIFIDSNNLFHAMNDAFGEGRHNIVTLAHLVCAKRGWTPGQINYYCGLPKKDHDPKGFIAATRRVDYLRRHGVNVVTRDLIYRTKKVVGPAGEQTIVTNVSEKGIDVRIALDVVRSAYENTADAIIIFSQDQDLSEVALDVDRICKMKGKFVDVCSAYPVGSNYANKRGLRGSSWIRIDREMYEASTHRPPKTTEPHNLATSEALTDPATAAQQVPGNVLIARQLISDELRNTSHAPRL